MSDGGTPSLPAAPAGAPASAPVPVPPAAAPPPLGYQRVVGRLVKVEIENYRAFRGRFELDLPEGANMVIYGENGAGKSSLFNAVIDFLESPERRLKPDDHRYRFATGPAGIKLSFSAPPGITAPAKTYEWSQTKTDPSLPDMRTVDKGKGCLDYRSLLRFHLLPTGQRELNLFSLFINPVLAHYRNPASTPSLTFLEEWKRIQTAFEPYARKPAALDDWMSTFNAGFERVAKDTAALASKLLSDFDPELAVEIEFTPASYSWKPKYLVPPKIIARPSFRLVLHPDYYVFLNEARLSALAIALYFAGLKNSPAGDLRLLVLDDILIGLDMANRMTVLGIVERLFKDWQVIILTYHKAWFEILKARTTDGKWSHPWRSVVLQTQQALGLEYPIVAAESGSLLSQAQVHFIEGDAKAAAVYARSAWEATMAEYCDKWRLPVAFTTTARSLKTDDFLRPIKGRLDTLHEEDKRELARAVLREIAHARRFVLNPNAHYDSELEDEISAEISAGIRAVEDFAALLRRLREDDFGPRARNQGHRTVGQLVFASLGHFDAGRRAAALDTLSRAFERQLDELFKRRREKVPYGATLNLAFLFTWAGRKGVFDESTLKLLRRAEPYLLGTATPGAVEPAAFQAAARLILQLHLFSLLSKKKTD